MPLETIWPVLGILFFCALFGSPARVLILTMTAVLSAIALLNTDIELERVALLAAIGCVSGWVAGKE